MSDDRLVRLCEWYEADDMQGEPARYMVRLRATDGGVSTDGSHSEEAGVTKAKRIHSDLWPKDGDRFFMVTIAPVPDVEIEVDEEAIKACQTMLASVEGGVSVCFNGGTKA